MKPEAGVDGAADSARPPNGEPEAGVGRAAEPEPEVAVSSTYNWRMKGKVRPSR